MEFKKVKIGEIKQNPKNPRIHKQENTDRIKESIEAFGFTNPIIVDENYTILAGHGRYQAGKDAGIKEVPIVIVDGLTEHQKKLYLIADNKLATLSDWDTEKLEQVMQELNSEIESLGFDLETLEITGFSEDEIKDLLDKPDEIEEVEGEDDFILDEFEEPVVQAGDIWKLGDHKIICGDSTERATYQELLGKEKADMILTDPPYNVAYEGNEGMTIENDDMNDKEFNSFLKKFTKASIQFLKENASGYIFFPSREFPNFSDAIESAGFNQPQMLIWNKNSFTLSFGKYKNKYEPFFYVRKGKKQKTWRGGNNKADVLKTKRKPKRYTLEDHIKDASNGENIEFKKPVKNTKELIQILKENRPDVIDFKKPRKNDIHPTMKPVGLLEQLISNSSYRGDLIIDPFSGSASTIIASEKLQRRCYAIELDPIYLEASIKRWENFTGREAIDQNGETLRDRKKEA